MRGGASGDLGGRVTRFVDRFKVGSKSMHGIRMTSRFLALFYTNLCLAIQV